MLIKKSTLFYIVSGLCLIGACAFAGLSGFLIRQPGYGAGYGFSYAFLIWIAAGFTALYFLSPKPKAQKVYAMLQPLDLLISGAAAALVSLVSGVEALLSGGGKTAFSALLALLFPLVGLATAALLLRAAFTASVKTVGSGVTVFTAWTLLGILLMVSRIYSRPDVLLYLPRMLGLFLTGMTVWKLYAVSANPAGKGLRLLHTAAVVGACCCPADALFWFGYQNHAYGSETVGRLLFDLLFAGFLIYLTVSLPKRPRNAAPAPAAAESAQTPAVPKKSEAAGASDDAGKGDAGCSD